MSKPDIVTSASTAQGNPAKEDSIKDTAIPVFREKLEEMKGYVFNVRNTLVIDVFSITMRNMTELINRTYKNGSNVKRFLDWIID